MNSQDFKAWALTKDRPTYVEITDRLYQDDNKARLLHAAVGISGEAGELMDSVKKTLFYGKSIDVVNLKEEAGDILWYMSLLLESIGSSFEEVMQQNHDKLEKRYPTKFTEELAQQRLDKQ